MPIGRPLSPGSVAGVNRRTRRRTRRRTAVVAGAAGAAVGAAAAKSGSAASDTPPQQTPSPGDEQNDVTGQLEKLAELHEKGILTDEEFAAKKQELLAKM